MKSFYYMEIQEDFENNISNYVSRANNQNVDGSVLIKCQQLLLDLRSGKQSLQTHEITIWSKAIGTPVEQEVR